MLKGVTAKSFGSCFPRIVPFFFEMYQVCVGIQNWNPLFFGAARNWPASLFSTSRPPPNLPHRIHYTMTKIVQPGGDSGQRRIRYTARRKYSLLATARHLRLGGKSLNRAAAELRVSASNLSKWEKVGVGSMDPKDQLFKSKKMCSHPGPPGQLATIDEPLPAMSSSSASRVSSSTRSRLRSERRSSLPASTRSPSPRAVAR